MSQIVDKISGFVAGGSHLKLSVYRGLVTPGRDGTVINFRFLDAGGSMATGSLVCTKHWEANGEQKKETYYANFAGFGEVAERLAGLQEGQEVLMVTERQRRKSQTEDRWFDNDVVIDFEVM